MPSHAAARQNLPMDKQEIEKRFRENLAEIVRRRGVSEAGVSLAAGLNRRFLTDLREGKVQSPKMSNAYAIAEALDLDLRDIIAGRDRPAINAELIDLLGNYSPDAQRDLLAAVKALAPSPASKP